MKTDDNYIKTVHKVGRLGAIIALSIMIGIPIILGVVYKCMPSFSMMLKTGGTLLIMFIPISLSEVISYAPILGSSSYITFITGNVTNLKLPVALNALEISKQEQATEEGDAIITVGVAMSSMITMLIIACGVVLMVPLQPILDTPAVQISTGFMLPALLGAMALGILNNKSGSYVLKNRLASVIPCALIFVGLMVSKLWNPMYQGVFIVAMIPVTVITARLLYKKGFIKVFKHGELEPPPEESTKK